jgi:hypothetical protein
LYSAPDIRVIKSRRIRQVGHAACMEEMNSTYSLKTERKRPIEGQEGNIEIILKKESVRL